jgi:hypothetical protein
MSDKQGKIASIEAAYAGLATPIENWKKELGGHGDAMVLDQICAEYGQKLTLWLERYRAWPISMKEEETTWALSQALEELALLEERLRKTVDHQWRQEFKRRRNLLGDDFCKEGELEAKEAAVLDAVQRLKNAFQYCLA